jgi:saccharopine dehydrogenase-like NADP-dependent oxidoreductase
MRIFVLGAGATGSFLAQLAARQGHTVWCGDKDPERARRFLGKKSPIPVVEANARNLWSIVRAARGCHLLVNASPAVFNEIILRAALRLRAHYLDLGAHLTRNPFRAEQLRYHKRFQAKNRTAIITAGVAPGLTNLLAARAAEMLDSVEAIHIRLFEETESEDPISLWSPDVSFDEASSRPRVYRGGRFRLEKRFSEREKFRFPPPIGEAAVFLAAQDEVGTLPHYLRLRDVDVKIGGNEIARLRRWYRQGKLHRSHGLVSKRFPKTPTPRQVARLIRRGILQNARFAAAVLVRGAKNEQPTLIRWDCTFPSLYQIRLRGMQTTPIAYATAHVAALFIKHFPRDLGGVYPPEALPGELRQAILAGVRSREIRMQMKVRRLKKQEDEEDYY